MEKRYLKVESAAELFDMNVRTLRMMCLVGQLKGRARKVGRRWYIPTRVMKELFGEESHEASR